jgi:arylsulfatase A-like enzyme
MKKWMIGIASAIQAVSFAQAGVKPNILLIMADDLGYADLSVHGQKQFSTPHIDALAHSGVRFTDGYVTAPVCAPSRAGMLTGRDQNRFGFDGNPTPGCHWGLPPSETTFARILQHLGYRTAVYGKWHLGEKPGMQPNDHGFDDFYGFLSGMHDCFIAEDPEWGPMMHNRGKADLNQYITFELADRACDFITRKPQPFFCFLSFNAPHTPLQAPKEYIQRMAHIQDDERQLYAAMVTAMDDAVGQVMAALRESGQEENTLVVFLSDNGGALLPGAARNGAVNLPLRGGKAQLWEGGIRVPFFIRWPGRITPGRVVDAPITALDLAPTFLELAGLPIPPVYEGVSLAEPLLGLSDWLHGRTFYWRFTGDYQFAIRDGDLKLVKVDREHGLFNLREDPYETTDIAPPSEPRRQGIRRKWDAWHRDNPSKLLHQEGDIK